MKTSHLLLSLTAAAALAGFARAGEFSFEAAHLLADNSSPGQVDVAVHFTDRTAAMRDAEGGDSANTVAPRALRGADGPGRAAAPADAPAEVPSAQHKRPAAAAADVVQGPAITPAAAAIRHPSYRWQSLVPGTIR